MARDPGEELITRELDKEAENPATQVAEAVADIEGKDPTELSTIYGCIDGVLDHIFSDPPSDEAQLEVEFSYEGYRVTVQQNGNATFVKTES